MIVIIMVVIIMTLGRSKIRVRRPQGGGANEFEGEPGLSSSAHSCYVHRCVLHSGGNGYSGYNASCGRVDR